MIITIDSHSGFCFGVAEAVRKAEESLVGNDSLYCLGDIVHNEAEVNRLAKMGLITIDHDRFFTLKNATVLLRAHGEPPATYAYARQNNIQIIDATCPIVLKLQQRIRSESDSETSKTTQVIIYGKKGHAEVNGLVGQTNGDAIVIESVDELDKIDFQRPVSLYAQTTKDLAGFRGVADELKRRAIHAPLKIHDTVCRQVSNRIPGIQAFAGQHDLILFVSGLKSSNGKMLFDICQAANPNSKLIASTEDLDKGWFTGIDSVGICGATSTPKSLLEKVAESVRQLTS